jgi:hypothetical protein
MSSERLKLHVPEYAEWNRRKNELVLLKGARWGELIDILED